MRRHLSPAAAILMLVLASRSGLAQDAPSAPATRVPANVFIARGPFANELSVVGSNGTFYRVRHDFGVLSLIPSYRFPTLTNRDQSLGPIETLLKLLIFTSDGRKIKEVDTE